MSNQTMQDLWQGSYLESDNIEYIEGLYDIYLKTPEELSLEWRNYFEQMTKGQAAKDESLEDIRDHFKDIAKKPQLNISIEGDAAQEKKESQVAALINAYRTYGHLIADLDPLKMTKRDSVAVLTLEYHGLNSADLQTSFCAGHLIGYPGATLEKIIQILKQTYCRTIGVEYMHIAEIEEVQWLQKKMEATANTPAFSADQKKQILQGLTQADGLEKFLGTKYVGQKRFSLEGGDSLIPMLNGLIWHATHNAEAEEFVIGMAHRGRLNVLVNILGKSPSDLFAEFEGKYTITGSGDVKYHKGYSSDVQLNGKSAHLALAFNPSHLEIVGPVVMGSVKARQARRKDVNHSHIVPIIIHGDAAVAGQGVVMESLNISQVRGFTVGGSVRIVINNQVGFTTSNPQDSRSTLYCTDVAKVILAPVFHVNVNDPEACVFVAQLAAEYRAKFHKDVFIDLVCYRRLGHNEADDPSITQPDMYAVIKQLPIARQIYGEKLVQEKVINPDDIEQYFKDYFKVLEAGHSVVKITKGNSTKFAANWSKYVGHELSESAKTAVAKAKLKQLSDRLHDIPQEFTVHPQVAKLLAERAKMAEGELPLNWGFAETLAYAALVDEGFSVRLCGQDSGRGTFAHRHAELHDSKTAKTYVPLSHIREGQANFTVIDSALSEMAVLAFEYGYAASAPETLDIWEAQFGDFANNAQVVIDQFISSGEQKWGRLCGLTMLLPHGFEGMGPEHSSARLERFLQLCAQQNMQVCTPTTPAQIFHLLRRQMVRLARKPLIIMSPKSLLRHKLATSTLDELTQGEFQLLIPEVDPIKAKDVKRVVICGGKVYYDLLQKRRDEKRTDVAIIRIEQLYPFPLEELKAELTKYKQATDIVWCQEEPENQGAWYQIGHYLRDCLAQGQTLRYAGRHSAASPAVGSPQVHADEQIQLVNNALA